MGMEIYNLNSEAFNNALNQKDKKIINIFLKLPNTIKKKIVLDLEDTNLLLSSIKSNEYTNIISLFQDDFIMFEKLYIPLIESLKQKKIGKRYRKCAYGLKKEINNIGNIMISQFIILANNNEID